MRSLKMLSIALYRFDSKINLWGIKWLEAYPTLDGGLRCKARFTHPTKNMNAKTHPSPAGAQTQHTGGLGQVPRRWLRVKRILAFGEYRVQHLWLNRFRFTSPLKPTPGFSP
jgi:hypothetical protein